MNKVVPNTTEPFSDLVDMVCIATLYLNSFEIDNEYFEETE